MNKPIFTYGTLKKGFSNHRILDGKYDNMEKGVTKGVLYNVACFPALIHGEEAVKGEIFYISDESYNQVVRSMDWLEGYDQDYLKDSMYIREIVEVEKEDGNKIECYTYIWNESIDGLEKLNGEFLK